MRTLPSKLVAAVGVCLLTLSHPGIAGTASIMLEESATTSAGVFDAEGRLLRTLWSGRRLPPGPVAIDWNGRDDDGDLVSQADCCEARILVHNVRYEWQGVIGNTSAGQPGDRIHRSLHPITDMAIDSRGNAFYVAGYNELQYAIHRFSTDSPQRRMSMAHDDYLRVFRNAATDGTLAYFTNNGSNETFVIALQVGDGAEHRFQNGRLLMIGQNWGNRWESVIDHDKGNARPPTGLAVQRRGRTLFVAHAAANEIRLFDKVTGELQGGIIVASPTDMDVAPDDSLWVIAHAEGKPRVLRFRKQGLVWAAVGDAIDGLINPVAIGVSPVDGTVVVADASTEQLHGFDAQGKPMWTLGRKGGYRDGGPEVANDRFWLSAAATYVAFQADGSFWFGDPGNVRNLHFSRQRTFLEQIMYLPKTYVAAVDPANPRRVFRHFLEFDVDYARPLGEAWRLVRNWGGSLGKDYVGDFDGFWSVATVPGGRTFGVVHRYVGKANEVVELTSQGVKRVRGPAGSFARLYAGGALRQHVIRGGSLKIYESRISEPVGDGTPRWNPPVLLAGVGALKGNDPYFHDVAEVTPVNDPRYPVTDGGIVVSFNPGRSAGFHLGGIASGSDRWQWRSSPTGTWDIDSDGDVVSRNGTYEIGRKVQYPGNGVTVSGNHIVYGYHGEAWNGGQANQWMHYLDNGLFVGQFGRAVYPAPNRKAAQPQAAGNAFNSQLVTVGGQLYLWHNDESVHGGLHRWRIAGADSIRILKASIKP